MKKLFIGGSLFMLMFSAIFANETRNELLSGKSILVIIGASDFADPESFKPKVIFEKEQARVFITSTTLGDVTGMQGGKVKPDILLKNVKVKDYDAIIFVGGYGAAEFLNDSLAHKIAKECIKQNKILGAICMAPAILEIAGELDEKKATCASFTQFSNNNSKVIDTGKSVERDGNIITGRDPNAATEFGNTILKALIEKTKNK